MKGNQAIALLNKYETAKQENAPLCFKETEIQCMVDKLNAEENFPYAEEILDMADKMWRKRTNGKLSGLAYPKTGKLSGRYL